MMNCERNPLTVWRVFCRQTLSRTLRLAVLLGAALVLLGPPVATAQSEEAPPTGPDNEADLDAMLGQLREPACASNAQLCAELDGFASGKRPCFASGDQIAVGHAYLIDDKGAVVPAQYFVVRSVRSGRTTLLQTQHVYAENADETRAAEDLIEAIKAGAVDQNNPLYQYIRGRSADIPQLLPENGARSAVVRSTGPTLFLRRAGDNLYVAVPGATLSLPGQSGSPEGLVFAVLPGAGRCR